MFIDPYEQFDFDLRSCNKCEDILAKFKVDPCVSDEIVVPRPVISGIRRKPVMVIGQTPGLTEYRTGKPLQGQAGIGIRKIMAELGVNDFDKFVFASAVVKCFPGRKHRKANDTSSKCEDRPPLPSMIRNCRPLLDRQVALADPSVIVTLGGVALKAYLEMTGQHVSKPRLEAYVGRSAEWNGRTVVFFPHTSGGSRWLNNHSNKLLFRKAQELLRKVLVEKELVSP